MHPNVAMNAKLSWPETPFLPVNDLVHVSQDVNISQARDEMENWFVYEHPDVRVLAPTDP